MITQISRFVRLEHFWENLNQFDGAKWFIFPQKCSSIPGLLVERYGECFSFRGNGLQDKQQKKLIRVRALEYLRVGCLGLVTVIAAATGQAMALDNISPDLPVLREALSKSEAEYKTVLARCSVLRARLDEYMGTMDDLLGPRNRSCTTFTDDKGQHLAGFNACSDRFFEQYDLARSQYRTCFDEETKWGEQRLRDRRDYVSLDIRARAKARSLGDAPVAPNGRRGWLGLRIDTIEGQITQGVLVKGTRGGSPASKAGMLAGDIVTGINGTRVLSEDALEAAAALLQAGDIAVLDITRAGQKLAVYIAVEER